MAATLGCPLSPALGLLAAPAPGPSDGEADDIMVSAEGDDTCDDIMASVDNVTRRHHQAELHPRGPDPSMSCYQCRPLIGRGGSRDMNAGLLLVITRPS